MKADFQRLALNDVELVLTPESEHEALLLALWMRFDANRAGFSVDRYENGRIERVRVSTENP